MGAELFKVTCVTCQASLSVRNAALIGQIVACPKCDSMVQIAPPAVQINRVPATPVVTAATVQATQPAFKEPLEQLAETIPSAVAEPVEIGSVLETAASSNVNFILWSVASFVIGAALTGAFLLFSAGADDEQTSAARISAPVVQTETVSVEAPEPTVLDPQPETPSKEKITPVAADVAAKSEAKTPEPTLLGAVEEPVEETPTMPPLPPQDPTPKLVIDAPQEPRVARKFDPLAIDPEQLDLDAMTETAAVEDPAPKRENATEEESPQNEIPPVNLPIRLIGDSKGGTVARSAAIQLRQVPASLTVKDLPLMDFLSLVSQLSGVPVSIDPEQLQMAGITPGRPVSLDVNSTTLADSLKTVLEPLHLEAKTDGPQIVIVRQNADHVRGVDYPIDDLLGGSLTAAEFAKWIEQLIAPESWEASGGDGRINVSEKSLHVDQAQAVQYQVLFFLERIRLERELPLRSKYPERLLSAKPLSVGIADRLAAPTTFTFSHETPLADVFRHWQGEAGMPIFVDWPALATENLGPGSLVTCAIANEPWHAALDRILDPLDLGWRLAAFGAIEITSRARVETEPQLEIYPAGSWHGDSTGAVVINDPVNKLTYVRTPASRLRRSD